MTERKRVPEASENGVMDVTNMNIYQKIMMVSSESGNIEKRLDVATKTDKYGKPVSSYKALSFEDVIKACKPALTLYHIVIIPEQDDNCGKEILSDEIVTRSTQYGDREERRVIMRSTLRILNADNPQEFIRTTGIGEGRDSGDKAYGKADTYSKKYALIAGLNLSIGDDPDKDASLEYYQTPENKQADKKEQKKEVKKEQKPEMQISPDLVNAINFERGQLGRYGIDVRSDKFISFMRSKTGIETTDPAKHTNASGTKLLSFLKGVRKAKAEQADVPDKVMDYDTGELVDNDDLPF